MIQYQLKKYHVKIQLLSDTLIGSGNSVPGVIDSDIKYDDYGIPYMSAKTMKGHIGEQIRWVCSLYPDLYSAVKTSDLLGSPDTEGSEHGGRLRFTDMTLSAGIADALREACQNDRITKDEIVDSLTILYTYTSLDEEGIAKDHTLRRVRMLRKNLPFEAFIYGENIKPQEEKLLWVSVQALQHIGSYKTKGKGLVRCEIE